MMAYKNTSISPILLGLLLLIAVGMAGCKSGELSSTGVANVNLPPDATAQLPPQGGSTDQEDVAPAVSDEISEADPAAIEAAWMSGAHADSFVLDSQGQNNTCARCHSPVNWAPSMDDLPESCFACKFELEAPPPTIPEADWANISCKVCHKVDKNKNVQPEYAWLEIAPLDEYTAVASTTDLCMKCHASSELPGHGDVQVGGAHAGFACTDCHSAHAASASCDAAGCHENVLEVSLSITGHDEAHLTVSCSACHDAAGMEVDLDTDMGMWMTWIPGSTAEGMDRRPFTSHQVAREVSCDRCHFTANPWGLSESQPMP